MSTVFLRFNEDLTDDMLVLSICEIYWVKNIINYFNQEEVEESSTDLNQTSTKRALDGILKNVDDSCAEWRRKWRKGRMKIHSQVQVILFIWVQEVADVCSFSIRIQSVKVCILLKIRIIFCTGLLSVTVKEYLKIFFSTKEHEILLNKLQKLLDAFCKWMQQLI